MSKKEKAQGGESLMNDQKKLPKEEGIQQSIKPKLSKGKYIVLGLCVGIPVVFIFISFVYSKVYEHKLFEGMYVAHTYVGGLSRDELSYLLKQKNEELGKGLPLEVVDISGKNQKVVVRTTLSENTSHPAFSIVQDEFVNTLFDNKKVAFLSGDFLYKPWTYLVHPTHFSPTISVDEGVLEKNLNSVLGSFEKPPQETHVVVNSLFPVTYTISPGENGEVFNYKKIISQLKERVREFNFSPLRVATEPASAHVSKVEVEKIASRLSDFFTFSYINLSYTDAQSHFHKEWKLKPEDIMSWVDVGRDEGGEVAIILNKQKATDFIEKNISPFVKIEPQDAVFGLEKEKVVEFKASRMGKEVDVDKTYQSLNSAFVNVSHTSGLTTTTVSVITKNVEPYIKTADVNSLGITDIIGVGISSFKGSHPNRIKNIAHAVERLNGVLIKPDEEFSANHYAGPYTYENGYVPELVIKGKEVKPEVGGGMCQIGTTLFRMAMNSGMDITERANHSLVVNYYADPVNGNPGTDATLYDPIHDLKFKNDTGNFLLLQTDIDYAKQQLTFTLWGKPDGRSGSYTHPLVSRWLGIGPPEEIVVDTLKPGQKDCQNAYRGAEASFTYTRITPQGEKIDRVFNSYYRSLPQICMVGKAATPIPPSCPEGQDCSVTPLSVPPSLDVSDDSAAVLLP
jgi:vancomycin resistance protein YoaR